MIRFLYDQELVELKDVSCNVTVLDWLRLHRHKTGTKEGCGSGDCGACTVVIASPLIAGEDASEPVLKYETLNSCITFAGALHGKQLLTVETLANEDVLHPVQQAMVDEHGSQCGFCTPGFVMSLFALYQAEEPEAVLKQRVDRALGGNLCRCTGYRPIRQAAFKALDARQLMRQNTVPRNTVVHNNQAVIARQLINLSSCAPECAPFHQPQTLLELAALYLDHPDYRLLGGGTDLALEVTQQLHDLPGLIHLGRVPELNEVQIHKDHLMLGASVTLNRCMDIMQSRIPGAGELLLRFGSDQVRNQGTIGGNIGSASPIGDLPPLLLALDAVLELQKADTVRQVPLNDFYVAYKKTLLQPGEFIRSIRLPIPAAEAVFAVHKVSKRRDDDISSVCLAVHLPRKEGVIEGARLAFGGMAATPVRATTTEAVFENQPFDEETVRRAQQALANELNPISDARASAAYRVQVAQNLLQRVLLESRIP